MKFQRFFLSLCFGFLLFFEANVSFAESDLEYWNKSYKYEKKGKYVLAQGKLTPFLADRDFKELALLRYAWLDMLRGNYQDARRTYSFALLENSNSIDARLGLINVHLAGKDWEKALSVIGQVLEIDPWNYSARVSLLVCNQAQAEWRLLAKNARDVIAHYPSDATPYVYLARAENLLGNIKIAKRAYSAVLVRVPNHYEAKAFLQRNR